MATHCGNTPVLFEDDPDPGPQRVREVHLVWRQSTDFDTDAVERISEDGTSAYSTAYINRFLRYSGSGHADTVVTEGQPVYLRFYLSPAGAQLALSKTHAGRIWGFWIDKPREEGTQLLMFEGMSTKGFAWVDRGDGEEVLMWKGEGDAGAVDEETVRGWKGWFLKDTPPDKFKGNPRVFADFDAEEGPGCARVDFIRHYVEG